MTPVQSETPATGIDRGSENASLTPSLRRIGATVEADLERTLWQLVAGEISLTDCTPALQAFWCVAAEQGRQNAVSARIERLEWEVDYWAFRAMNPGKDYYRAMTERMWSEAVAA